MAAQARLASAAPGEPAAPSVPWKTLLELIGDINYGGRVTDDKVRLLAFPILQVAQDQRCVRSLLRQYFTDSILKVCSLFF